MGVRKTRAKEITSESDCMFFNSHFECLAEYAKGMESKKVSQEIAV